LTKTRRRALGPKKYTILTGSGVDLRLKNVWEYVDSTR